MSNPCKETYQCTACCEDMRIRMTMREFNIFAQAWLARGSKLCYTRDKRFIYKNGDEYTNKYPEHLLYAGKRTLDDFHSGRGPDTEVLVVFAGLCANNQDGNCTIQDQKPLRCNKFEFDGHGCREERNTTVQSTSANFIPLSALEF